MSKRYIKFGANDGAAERSTCGYRVRLWKQEDGGPASISRLLIDNAKPHYHLDTHEYYYVIAGTGMLVIDGEDVPLGPGDSVWIQPGAVHHAAGEQLEALVIGVPPFRASDIFFPAGVVATQDDRH